MRITDSKYTYIGAIHAKYIINISQNGLKNHVGYFKSSQKMDLKNYIYKQFKININENDIQKLINETQFYE